VIIFGNSALRIQETDKCFAIGSCIKRSNIQSEVPTNFFVMKSKDDLKWYYTEAV
jgi:hypothetical protein